MNSNFTDIWSEDLKKIIDANPGIMDQWVVVIAACHQYAEGICGQDFYTSIIFKEMNCDTGVGCGFDKKGDWRRELDPKWIRSMTKRIKGRKTAYGEVGAHYRITKVLKFKDLVRRCKNDPSNWFFKEDIPPFGRYFKYSTPRAVDGRKHMANPVPPAEISVA